MGDENRKGIERVSLFSAASAESASVDASTASFPVADTPATSTPGTSVPDVPATVPATDPHATAVFSPYDAPVQQAQKVQPVSHQPAAVPSRNDAVDGTTVFPNPHEQNKEAEKARKAEEKALCRHDSDNAKKKKRTLIGVGIAAGILVIAYFSGAYVYSHRFFPHTTFGAINVSNTTFEDATNLINASEKDYSLTVTGKGLDFDVTPTESGMDIDAKQIVNAAREKMNPWSWPIQWFKRHNLVESADVTLDDTALGEYVLTQVNTFNEKQPVSKDARIEYDQKSSSFTIIPEVYGKQLDGEKVVATVTSCIFQRVEECTLSDKEMLAPTAHADDKKVIAGAKAANNMLGVDAEFHSPVEDKTLGTLNSALLGKWVVFDKNFKPSVNQKALSAWAVEMVRPVSTVGATRSYTRPDGKEVTVSGGTFGCSVSNDVAVAAINKAIKEKKNGRIELERQCVGAQAPEGSDNEWGAYVDVDLSEQHARYYDASGNVLWESGVVSGNVSEGHSTPTGLYYVNNMQRDITLLGRIMPNGEREYESKVAYWMPFVDNSVGFHDANWRSGGEFNDPGRYRENGSHGCVNLPPSAAASLYSKITVGTPVIVHN